MDQPLFSPPPSFNRDQNEGTSGVDIDTNNPFSSSPRQNLDDVFADLTNQDADAVEPMENTHANEALEALAAGNNGDRPDSDHEGETAETGRDGEAEGNGEGPADDF